MGIDRELGAAFAKSQAGGGWALPEKGTIFVSVADRDKRSIIFPAKKLAELGFDICATDGTAEVLKRAGVPARSVRKHSQGTDNITDEIIAGQIDLVINTPFGRGARSDGYFIRTAGFRANIPCITTLSGVQATVQGIESLKKGGFQVTSLQEYLGLVS